MWLREAPVAPLLLLLSVLALGGCQVRPLYAPTSGEPGPQADLPAIAIAPPVTREEQSYRNALLFAFRGGSAGDASRYTLDFRLTIREAEILVERNTGIPNAYQLTGAVSFLLKDAGSGASLFGAQVNAVNSYTRSSQNFANIRARRDAEDRLAKALAELTAARLAAYFATH